MMEKTCKSCGHTKPATDFYAQPGNSDGLAGKCKECAKASITAARKRNAVHYSAYEQQRAQDPARKLAQQAVQVRMRQRNPEKKRARTVVSNALRDGRLTKQPCAHCGATENVQAHHHDYSKPLDVKWVCFKCHREVEHGQVVVAA